MRMGIMNSWQFQWARAIRSKWRPRVSGNPPNRDIKLLVNQRFRADFRLEVGSLGGLSDGVRKRRSGRIRQHATW